MTVMTEGDYLDAAGPVVAYDEGTIGGPSLDPSSAGSALDFMKQVFLQYGLPDSLLEWAEKALRNPEMTTERLLLDLRTQPEYKTRFPAMEELAKQGRALTEAEYIAYERGVVSLAQQYGMPEEMFTRDYMANMLRADVSVREFEERVGMAARNAEQVPAEVKQAFQEMYGLGSDGALRSYFLDPDNALPVIQRREQAARIGGEAIRYGFAAQQALMERLATQGVDAAAAQEGFQTARSLDRLTGGYGETVNEKELVGSQFGDQDAARRLSRVQGSRTASFQGNQGTQQTGEGVTSLGGSNT